MADITRDIQVFLSDYEHKLKWELFQKWKSSDVYDGPVVAKPKPLPTLLGYSKRDIVVFTDPHDTVYKLKDLRFVEEHLKRILEERGITVHEGHDECVHPDSDAAPWIQFAHAYYRFPKTCVHSPYISGYDMGADSDERLLALYFQSVVDQKKLRGLYPVIPKVPKDTRTEIDIDQAHFASCY
jgi:hypothetical protein